MAGDLFSGDPISGTIGAILAHGLEKNAFKLVRGLITLGMVAVIAFLIACGTALMANQPWTFCLGSGMVTAGVCMLGTYRVNDDFKGIHIEVSTEIEQAAKQAGLQEEKR